MMSISLQNSSQTYISCSKATNFWTFCKLQISDKKCPTHPFLLGGLIMQTEWHHRGWSSCWRRRHVTPWYPTSSDKKATKQIRPFFVIPHFLRLQFENGGRGVPSKPVHFSVNHHWRKSRLTIYLKVVPIFEAQSFVETGPRALPSSQNYACWRNYKLLFQAQHHARRAVRFRMRLLNISRCWSSTVKTLRGCRQAGNPDIWHVDCTKPGMDHWKNKQWKIFWWKSHSFNGLIYPYWTTQS